MFAGKLGLSGDRPSPDDLREILSFVRGIRASAEPFDVVVAGETTGSDLDRDRESVEGYESVATWWLEHIHQWRGSLEGMRQRIRRGPPRG
jgi:hypothetical protein